MKSIGIVVCNYNKQDDVTNAVRSILLSTIEDFDVYVVDNASTDESVRLLDDEFGEKIIILQNTENLGGSGGFNTGLREAMKYEYEYIMCVDNDVFFDPDAIRQLWLFLQEHKEVGMAGSCVYFMSDPDKIWNFGGRIDFEHYVQKDLYRNDTEAGVPDYHFCDYVPACALMVRTEALKKTGLMPEDNFIYWDDMEWGYRFNQAGFKVAAVKAAKVWHKVGGRNAGNTFIHYYMWRNRIHFFSRILDRDKREHFADTLLEELFRMIYSCNLKQETNIVRTVMYAFYDAQNGVRGKAEAYKILERKPGISRLKAAMGECGEMLLRYSTTLEALGNVIREVRKINPAVRITISMKKNGLQQGNMEEIRRLYPDCTVTEDVKSQENHQNEIKCHFTLCSHIFKLPENSVWDRYIDGWCNLVYSEEDYLYAKNFNRTRDLFILCQKGIFLDALKSGCKLLE